MTNSLKQQTFSGIIWSSVQRFGSLAVSFISSIVLARLLTPEDYGIVGVLAIFITISLTFIDGGFASALIQKKNPTQADYSTIFYWNIILAVFLYFVLFFAAPAIASFYNIPLLTSVLRVQGLILIINSFQIIPNNRLNKKLKFKPLSIITVLSSILSVIAGIILAMCDYGVWSLVYQQLLNSTFLVIFLWFYDRWIPDFIFDLQSFKELFGFGSFMLLSNLINNFCNNIQGIIIGKMFSVRDMGLYSKAQSLEQIPTNTISQIIMQVTYPIFSTIQDDQCKLRETLSKIISSLAYITVPLMFLLILIAKPLIILFFSDRWVESIPYFQILCLSGIAVSMQNINYIAVASVGKSKLLFKWTILKRLIGLCFIALGLIWGIKGLLWGMVFSTYTIYFVNAKIASRIIGYSLLSQIKDLLPILIVSIISLIISSTIQFLNIENIYLLGLLQMVTFVFVYFLFSYLFKIQAFNYSLELLSKFLKRS